MGYSFHLFFRPLESAGNGFSDNEKGMAFGLRAVGFGAGALLLAGPPPALLPDLKI